MNRFIEMANEEALTGSSVNDGGPFGAVITKAGKVISRGHNEVLKTNDPTAHAEIVAIRRAAQALGSYDLSGCEIHSSCEPCPMCLAAIYWARISKVYYGCTKEDAASIGFDDNAIYEYIKNPANFQTDLQLIPSDREACLKTFAQWSMKQDKVIY